MAIQEIPPITLRDELCSRCAVCLAACPFEAISRHEEKIVIDLEKCMLCGICASVCPSGAIVPYYYGSNALIEVVEAKKAGEGASLVVACRGSTAPDDDLLGTLEGLKVEQPILMRVPCVGRLPSVFYITALSMGIKQIVVVQCTQDFCRFDKGSLMNERRVAMLQSLLKPFGYGDNTITIIERAKQIEYDTAKCVGCDKCINICPYGAIEAQPLSTPKVDHTKCTGCGACAVVCPHVALEIHGHECARFAELIMQYADRVKETRARSPAILVLCCQWAEFANLDQDHSGFIEPNVAILEIPCYSKLDPINVFQALLYGFDGVLVVACGDDDCKSKESRLTTENNMKVLRTSLRRMGLENRFRVHKTSPKNLGDFKRELDFFANEVLALKGGQEAKHE
jgi:coenzyme F420-reducing hydrogenase delta subunit/formate hydrogenlyase subunit 6/NADH:ubiquinone oxidoreductase subunit I